MLAVAAQFWRIVNTMKPPRKRQTEYSESVSGALDSAALLKVTLTRNMYVLESEICTYGHMKFNYGFVTGYGVARCD